jgi:NAD(P)-dependent dehydrogenase (short-subunit alcohol dehydrogenase family)
MIPAEVFLPTANPSHAAILALTTGVVFPPPIQPGLSAYIASKLALVKVIEYIAAENPSAFAAALNPGVIKTAMYDKLGIDADGFPFDNGMLQNSTD